MSQPRGQRVGGETFGLVYGHMTCTRVSITFFGCILYGSHAEGVV